MTDQHTQADRVSLRISDANGAVTVRKVFTRTGERLELIAHSLDQSIRLDAIALESLAWQDPAELREWATAVDRSEATEHAQSVAQEDDRVITVSNEYALARVKRVSSGKQLEVTAPKLGYSVELGPMELAWVTTQDHQRFTEWLETPFGPAGEDHDH